MVTVGVGVTEIVTVCIAEQVPLVAVTEYGVVTDGDTVILLLFEPVFHVYDVAPVAVSTAEFPEQSVGEDVMINTVGEGNTVIVITLDAVHVPLLPANV